MRWEDERYVRLYTRDTTSWVLGPWEARAVLGPVMRRLDRAGILDLGTDGMEGLAALVLMPPEVVEPGMAWWLKRGTFELRDGRLVMPNFLDAQESAASDAQRARESRARARDLGKTTVTNRDDSITERDDTITNRTESSQPVTDRHDASQPVTPCCAVPSRADPPVAPPRGARGTRLPEDWSPSEDTVRRFRERERVDHRASLERFRNHWLAKTGRGATKLDWDLTFVNWVLRDIADGRAQPWREPIAESRPAPVAPDAMPPEQAALELEKLSAALVGAGKPPWEKSA